MHNPLRRLLGDYFNRYRLEAVSVLILLLAAQLSALVEPIVVQHVVDRVLPDRNLGLLLILSAGAIAIRILAAFIRRVQEKVSTSVAAKVFKDFTVDFYSHLQRLDLAFFADTRMGEFMQRLGQDTYHVYRMVFNGLVVIIGNVIVVIALLSYGLYLSPILSGVLVAIIPLYVLAQRHAGRLTRRATEAMVRDWADVASFQTEKLGGIRLVKELAAERKLKHKYAKLNEIAGKAFRQLELAGNLGQILSEITVFLGPVFVIALGGYLTMQGALTLGALLAFFYFSAKLFSPVGVIVTQSLALHRARVGVTRIYEYLDRQPAIKEPDSPQPLPEGALSVKFDSVRFAYSNDRAVFDSFTLSIQSGETVGIVGVSGAGKSTLANLIYRFWDVDDGAVLVGGRDVKDLALDDLRGRLAIVSQETILFHDTIAENLRLARPHADDDDLRKACETAGIWDFIASLPEGLGTVVGERGVKLSGGQRQRLSIARAVLREPDLLLLDEATSHLDTGTERAVQSALSKVIHGRTTIVIAHRLSTLVSCDRIVAIEDGNIVESGTHAALLGNEGLYYRLWALQNTESE